MGQVGAIMDQEEMMDLIRMAQIANITLLRTNLPGGQAMLPIIHSSSKLGQVLHKAQSPGPGIAILLVHEVVVTGNSHEIQNENGQQSTFENWIHDIFKGQIGNIR